MRQSIKIYMPTPFPEPLSQEWADNFQVAIDTSGFTPSREKMMEQLSDSDVVVLNLDDVLDEEMIDGSPKLKVIALFAGDPFNIAVDYARSKGIKLVTVMGEIYENTADLTFALLMSVARNIPQADAWVKEGKYTQWHSNLFLGADIHGKTLGILGLGTIGSAVARRAKGFDMKIIYTNASGPKPELESEFGCEYVSLEELIKTSDFLTLHCKLTPETHHIIGFNELHAMKSSAYLINTGRGALVDEAALADALERKVIAGAGLDVFEYEPEVNTKLLKLSNVVLTPHLGASSLENRIYMADTLKKGILNALGIQIERK